MIQVSWLPRHAELESTGLLSFDEDLIIQNLYEDCFDYRYICGECYQSSRQESRHSVRTGNN